MPLTGGTAALRPALKTAPPKRLTGELSRVSLRRLPLRSLVLNVVFLSPQFPPQYFLFCRALKAEGARVLGVGDAPEHSLAHELREALDGYFFVPDLNRHDDLARAVGYFEGKHGRIDRIESLNESWLEAEARLREEFDVPGMRLAETQRLRKKSGMKPFFAKAGVPVPRAEPWTGPDGLRKFAQECGFPLVLKPDTGVGAAATYKLENESDLEAAVLKPLEGYLIEEFVRGDIVTYDGLVDREGRIIFVSSFTYNEGLMELVNGGLDGSYWTTEELPAGLDEVGRRTVQALGLVERFFHLEFFRLADGSYRALEVNLRPPGGFSTDMMNWSADRDLYRLWAKVLTGQRLDPEPVARHQSVLFAGRRHENRYRHSHAEIVREFGPLLMGHRIIPAVFTKMMGDEGYLLRHPELAVLKKARAFILERA